MKYYGTKSSDEDFVDKKYVDDAIDEKQDKITSSTDITMNDLIASTMTGGLTYVTEAPTADNTDGIKLAVLSTEPSTKYNGWWYIITS